MARALAELPAIRERFASGQLSYSKVRALTRVAAADSEDELLELARYATAGQLERMLRAYRRVTAEQAERAHEDQYLAWSWNEDGSLEIRGRVPAESGALVLRALEAAKDSIWSRMREEDRGGSGPETPGRDTRRAPLAPDTARRIACDASVVSMLEAEGSVLSVRRKTRAIPPAMRRALQTRDRGCRFPGCENHRFLDAHHVRHWAKGGETNLDNLVQLCARHHRLLHEGGFDAKRLPDGRLCFWRPDGTVIPDLPGGPASQPSALSARNRRASIDVESGGVLTGTGERMDVGLAVDAVVAAVGAPP